MTHSLVVDGKECVLHVGGELDALSRTTLLPVLDALVKEQRAVCVDLSELRMIDGSGVGALVSLYKRFRAKGGVVRFVGVKSQPLVLFKLLHLDQAFLLS
jgi:anti-sigma B factor antagonist